GGFLTRVADNVPAVLLRNRRLCVGQIGHQCPVTRAPAGLSRGRGRLLHTATPRHSGNYECNGTPGSILDSQTTHSRTPIFETEYRWMIIAAAYAKDSHPHGQFLPELW